MAKSTAQRQREYRARALQDPDGLLLSRLQVLISPQASAALERICKTSGKTKRQVIEQAIVELEQRYSVT